MARYRDRCPFNAKPAVEWPLIAVNNDAAGCLGDGANDDVTEYGRGGKTAVYYDSAGELQYNYKVSEVTFNAAYRNTMRLSANRRDE